MMALPVPVQHVSAPELAGQVRAFNPCTHSCCQPTNYLMIPVYQPPPPPYDPSSIPTTSTGISKGSNGDAIIQKQAVQDDSVNNGSDLGSRHVFKSKSSPRSSPTISSSMSPRGRPNVGHLSPRNQNHNETQQAGGRRDYKRSRALTDKWFALQRRANEQVQQNRQRPKKTLTIPFDPRKWTPKDVHTWLFYTINMNDIEDVDFSYFVMNGQGLCLLKESNFVYRVPNPGGKILFRDLRLRLWRCLKTEKAFKNRDASSNPEHVIQSRSQQPFLHFGSNPVGVRRQSASSDLPHSIQRNDLRNINFSTEAIQRPLNISDSQGIRRPSELSNHSPIGASVSPRTASLKDKPQTIIPNSHVALNLTTSHKNDDNRRDTPHAISPKSTDQEKRVLHKTDPSIIDQFHQQRQLVQGSYNFPVSHEPSDLYGRKIKHLHNTHRKADETGHSQFQGPQNATHQLPKHDQKESPPYRPNPFYVNQAQQEYMKQLYQVSKSYEPHQRENSHRTSRQLDKYHRTLRQKFYTGPMNIKDHSNSMTPELKANPWRVSHPNEKVQRDQRSLKVLSKPSDSVHLESVRSMSHYASQLQFQGLSKSSKHRIASNLSVSEQRENLRHIEKHHSFKHPAKSYHLDRHLGSATRSDPVEAKSPMFPRPWDYDLRVNLARRMGHLPTEIENNRKSKHSSFGSDTENMVEHAQRLMMNQGANNKEYLTENALKLSSALSKQKSKLILSTKGKAISREEKPLFMRSESCPVSDSRKDTKVGILTLHRADSHPGPLSPMDQSTTDTAAAESELQDSYAESVESARYAENISHLTNTFLFQRSNSNPEITSPLKGRVNDIYALQRCDSHPGALSPRRIDQSTEIEPIAQRPSILYNGSDNKETDHLSTGNVISNSEPKHSEIDSMRIKLSPKSYPDTSLTPKLEEIPKLEHCSQNSAMTENHERSDLPTLSPGPKTDLDNHESNHDQKLRQEFSVSQSSPSCSPVPGHFAVGTSSPSCSLDPGHLAIGTPSPSRSLDPGHDTRHIASENTSLPVKVKQEPMDDYSQSSCSGYPDDKPSRMDDYSQSSCSGFPDDKQSKLEDYSQSSCLYPDDKPIKMDGYSQSSSSDDKPSKMETDQFVCKLENEYIPAAESSKTV